MKIDLKSGEHCSVEIFSAWGRVRHYCTKKVTVKKNDNYYCAQHDPQAVKEREEKRTAKFKHDQAIRAMGWYGISLYDALEMLVVKNQSAKSVTAAIKALRSAKPYRELLRKGKPL